MLHGRDDPLTARRKAPHDLGFQTNASFAASPTPSISADSSAKSIARPWFSSECLGRSIADALDFR